MDVDTRSTFGPFCNGCRRRPDVQNNSVGRPDDVECGRPDDVECGRPDDVECGRPDDVERGRPDDVERGRPDDVERGRPDDAETGRRWSLHHGPKVDLIPTSVTDVRSTSNRHTRVHWEQPETKRCYYVYFLLFFIQIS